MVKNLPGDVGLTPGLGRSLKEMATHSCIAWRIPWTEEPNGLCASQVALVVKNLPASAGEVRDMNFDHLEGEDPLEEGMANHSSILAWRIPWTEEPGRLRSIGWQRVGHD